MAAKIKNRKTKRIAIIDIGSNSVRMVVYKHSGKSFKSVMDQKATCRLASGMDYDHPRLNPVGMRRTLKAMQVFRATLAQEKITEVIAIGTAALRAVQGTRQGQNFHHRLQEALGHKISIISGREEARLTAYGLMGYLPKAIGICGDLGGGSLELASVKKGRIGHTTTLALGTLTLLNETGGDAAQTEAVVRNRIRKITWLKKAKNQTFYAIGGSWRGVGRVIMQKTGKNKGPVHGFKVRANVARVAAALIAEQKPSAFHLMHKKISRRADIIPVAAATLVELIDRIQPKQVIFSGHGVREGIVWQKIHKRGFSL